jgi:hypothetical protein
VPRGLNNFSPFYPPQESSDQLAAVERLKETKGVVTVERPPADYSLPFSAGFDGCCSTAGRSLVVGGEEVAEGGEAAWLADSPS